MSPAVRAALFALLLMGPTLGALLPPATASHWEGEGGASPDAPVLPPVRPGSECAETAVPARVLRALGAANDPGLAANATNATRNGSYFAQGPQDAPMLCVFGQPVAQYGELIRQADVVLESFRRAAREAQRQVDQRGEAVLPEGNPLRPTFSLLDDRFDGARKGGFGAWTVVTERGEPGAFRVEGVSTPTGTEHAYRFGDASGYARGVHQWLVSPELDLTPVKSQEETAQALLVARAAARDQLRSACNNARVAPGNPPALRDVCGDAAGPVAPTGVPAADAVTFRAIFDAYEAALDDVLADMPVMQHTATLDLTYRLNMASQVDGVRVWLYRGERAPDRETLFGGAFGLPREGIECPTRPLGQDRTDREEADAILCTPRLEGGKVLHDLPGARQTVAFREDAPLSRGGPVTDRNALTGDLPQYVTARVNLTEYAGERLWLLFEVKTVADSGRGESWFDSASVFPRAKDFGFQLRHVNATGEAYLRNFRLKDVGGELPGVPRGNPFGDNHTRTRTAMPGPALVDVRVHNAGLSTENGTVTLRLYDVTNGGIIQLASARADARQVKPGEARSVPVLLDATLQEGRLYRYDATLDVEEARGVRLENVTGQPTRNLDPNATVVRANNSASQGIGGALNGSVTVRAYTRHALATVKASGDAGPAFEVCGDVSASFRCTPQHAARKGEARTLLLGVRNDGNLAEDVTATLHLTLEGADKSTAILDGALRALKGVQPGELRALRWSLNPTEPGAWNATVFLQLADGATLATISRLVYVQRSTGLVCLDDFSAQRECGPSFVAAIPEAAAGRDVTALEIDAAGRAWAVTHVARDAGALLAREPGASEWKTANDVSQNALGYLGRPRPGLLLGPIRDLEDTPQGLAMVGDNLTVLLRTPQGELLRVATNASVDVSHLTSAAWWNGTLWAAGTNGTLLRLAPNGRMERVDLATPRCDEAGLAPNATVYAGRIHDLLAVGTRLYAVGEGGWIFSSFNGGPFTAAASEANPWTPRLRGDGKCAATIDPATPPGKDLRALALHSGTVYAAGDGGLMLFNATSRATTFNLSASVPMPGFDARAAFVSHFGDLHLLDARGVVASCLACKARRDAAWTFPELPVPSVPVGQDHERALLTVAASGPGATLVAGQGGVVLDLAQRGEHDNLGDWTVANPLVARDGGVWQTTPTSTRPQALRFEADDAGRATALEATRFRVTLNHYVQAATPQARGELRILWEDYPNFRVGENIGAASAVSLCPRDRYQGSGEVGDADVGTVCHREELMRTLAAYEAPSRADRWERVQFELAPPTIPDASGSAQGRDARFAGLEFYREAEDGRPAVLWAVDDVVVEALVNGQWRPVLWWYGPEDRKGLPPDVDRIPGPLADYTAVPEWEESGEVFGFEPRSAWHLSTALAERPVFALNDEEDGFSVSSEPHLRSGWNARLLSPILDLGDAHEPVVSFRHLYAFRTYAIEDSGGVVRYQHGDTGRVELQWLMEGPEECPGMEPGQTCGWSAFVPVAPVGGYPNLTASGYGGAQAFPAAQQPAGVPKHAEHDAWGPDAAKPDAAGRSFWGRNMEPNDRNAFDAAADLSNYQEVRVDLKALECGLLAAKGCIPSLAGRKVRVALHAITAPDDDASGARPYNHTDENQIRTRTSFGREGWYVADFKVLGARKLGIDLAAENLTIPVGFDWQRIGVGPGTRVPVNVTVVNRGAFEALGYKAELVVRKVVDPLRQEAPVVDRLVLPQQPVLDPGARANHTLLWNVPPEEGAQYLLQLVLSPLGIARDEDPTDNVALLGGFVEPLLAKTHRDHRVEVLVTPEDATTDITRYVPIFLHNLGNVPQEGIVVTREITLLQGPQTRVVDQRTFTAQRAVPQGQRVPLAAVADLNPSEDLFWKAPERANFLFSVGSETPQGDEASDETRVSAFATFLFDDVDEGLRGEATSGAWTMQPGWGRVDDEGFRSGRSLAFGDADAQRYGARSDASLVSPVLDLAGARSARVAFYHRYKFEPGYDAGALEASADGGRTWTTLQPIADPLRALPRGYPDATPLSAASPLHPTGDPGAPAYAFTGDSRGLPETVDGWTLSQFDLTRFDAITERDVPYESYRSEQLAGYLGSGLNTTLAPSLRTNATYTDKTWMVGSEEERRYWEVQNLGQDGVTSPTDEGTFWWSGSAHLGDDGKRPLGNHALNVTLDLRGVQPDEAVLLGWWEWSDRYGQRLYYQENEGDEDDVPLKDLRSVATFHSGQTSQNWRYNVTEPTLVEKQGKWLRFVADMSPRRGELVHLQFVYAPVKRPVADGASNHDALEKDDRRYETAMLYDRGFAIDGLHAVATKVVNGQPATRVLLTEQQAWANRREADCDRPGGSAAFDRTEFKQGAFACFSAARQPHLLKPVLRPGVGRSWSLVQALPAFNGTWKVVPVVDEEGRQASNPLPSGTVPRAWWTGDTRCAAGEPCQMPGSQTRLVTPMIDLGRIAGEEAILTFDHRYAFHNALSNLARHPFASGGVVEMQELDPQTGEWSAWRQLYPRADAMDVGLPGATAARDGVKEGLYGGYSGYTVNDSRTLDGQRRRYDPPFQAVHSAKLKEDVQFLYTGNSSALTGTRSGWTEARFDVSEHVGKKVRFGFHAYLSPVQSDVGTNGHLGPVIPDTDRTTLSTPRGGWWIGDVEIVGKILKADQVLLRLRAVTDANVDEGAWQVDDLGVYGAKYSRAVGVFADESKAYGATLNDTVTIPVTIRNMGDSVRRDLAVEVRLDPPQRVTYDATAPKGTTLTGDLFRMTGFTLGPGRSTTVNLTIRAPPESAADLVRSKLLVDLKEYNPSVEGSAGIPFEAIPDNEVQGILQRVLTFEVAKQASVDFTRLQATPALGRVGAPVDLRVEARNDGHATLRLDLTCVAETVLEYRDVDHARPDATDEPIARSTVPCEQVTPTTNLTPGANVTLVYRATPADEGMLRFTLKGRMDAGNASRDLAGPLVASAAVARSPVAYENGFAQAADLAGWRMVSPASWSRARGHASPGALLLGISDEASAGSSHDYSGGSRGNGANYSATSPPVDLHNLTGGAFLGFWHQDRFARWDGGQVKAQVKVAENAPDELGWSKPCLLRPVGGYEGFVLSFTPNASELVSPDVNPGALWPGMPPGVTPEEHRRRDYFVSDGPNGGTPEDRWSRAVFDLRAQPECPELSGRTVRFVFVASVGSPNGALKRGLGQGWLIDDVSVGPFHLDLRPVDQKGFLLDNTTKEFSLLLRNRGSFPDVVRLRVDEANSSVPAGSLRVPEENVTLAAGETRQVLVNVTLPRDPSLLPSAFKARVVAQSLLDRAAEASTVLDLAFMPRPWAELGVSATAPPQGGHAGAETFIPVIVENHGLVESVPTTLRIVDRWSGGEDVTLLDLPSMPSFFQKGDEATRTLEFRWRPAEGSVGEHALTFEVDPEARGQEYTRTNNVFTLVVPVTELPLPDLAISSNRSLALRSALGQTLEGATEGDVTRYETTAGELVTFELKVLNRGRAGATNVQVRAAIGTLNLPTRTIPYVGPGAEAVIPFNWLAQKGDHALEFQVVTEQFELGTLNNRNPAQGVTLLTVKDFEVGIQASRLPDVLQPGTSHRLFLNLTNPGHAGEDVVLRAEAPKGVRVVLAREGAYLRSGERLSTFAQVSVGDEAVAGQQFISIVASARGNPMKSATASVPAAVEAQYGGSVVPARVEASPPTLVVPVRLANEGNSLEPWTVDVRLPAGWTVAGSLPAKVVVPARGTATLELRVSVPAGTAPGPRPITVDALMPDGERREGTVTVDVRPHRVAAVALAPQAEARPANGSLAYPLTVENLGNVQQPFEMVLVGVPAGVEARVEPATFSLAPGARANATLTLVPRSGVADGTYAVTGYALFRGVDPDTAEGRLNHQQLRVPLHRPDLSILGVEAVPRADVKVGDRVAVKVPIRNAGTSPAGDLPVHLYVDDVFVAETRVGLLAPGARAEVVLNWTALPGKHVLTAVVDPWNDTVDAERADNAASLVIDVGSAAPVGGFAAERIPGPGLLLSVLAALAAAFVAARRGPRRP